MKSFAYKNFGRYCLATALLLGNVIFPTIVSAQEAPKTIKLNEEKYVTTEQMAVETGLTAYFLSKIHLLQKPIAKIDMNVLLETYIASLDPSRSIFYQGDIDLFKKRFAPSLDSYINDGRLNAAFEIYSLFRTRLGERIEWTLNRLDKPFNLYRDDSLKIIRKDEKWFATEKELNDFWEKRLTNDIIIEMMSSVDKKDEKKSDGKKATPASKIEKKETKELSDDEKLSVAIEKIRQRYNKMLDNLKLEIVEVEEIFLNSLCSQYDPHTSFFSKQSMEDFEIAMRNSLCGIGAVLFDDGGYCTIREIVPGGPLERSGKFSVGDRIVAVANGEKGEWTDVVGLRLNKVVKMLRGKKGETIRLTVESASDHSIRFQVSLKRDDVKLTAQLASAKLIEVPTEDGKSIIPVGVIELPSFYGRDSADKMAFSTTDDVRELLGKLKAKGIKALVLDLRMNGGGYLKEAIDLTELFVGSGKVAVLVKDARESISTMKTGDNGSLLSDLFTTKKMPEWDGPMIVLVSKASASASEIVAGALRDLKRAIIVGDPQSHGKGSVQEVIPFSALKGTIAEGAIKVTRSKWYSPSGKSIQIKGVAADIAVPSVFSVLPIGEGDLDRALPWDFIPSAIEANNAKCIGLKAPISDELIEMLNKNSQKRRLEKMELLTLNSMVLWFEEKDKNKQVELNLKKRKELKAEDKKFSDLVKNSYIECAKNEFKTTLIHLKSYDDSQKDSDKNKKSILDKSATMNMFSGAGNDSEEEKWPDLDVVLRESGRIAADWVSMIEKSSSNLENNK